MLVRCLAVVVILLCAVASAADSPAEVQADRLARMAHRIDVQAAMGEVADCETVVRWAGEKRDATLVRLSKDELKVAKRDLAAMRERGHKYYLPRARRAVETQAVDRPDRDDGMDAVREKLSPGEFALERMRFAGPVVIAGVALGRNSIGSPQVTISVGNMTDRTVEAFDVEMECWNSFDEPVEAGGDNVVGATCQRPLEGGQADTAVWNLPLHDTTTRIAVRITRAKPQGGNIWSQTREEAARSPGAIVEAKMRR